MVKEAFSPGDKKRRRITENRKETIQAKRNQVLDEVEYMIKLYDRNSDVQIEDYWKKTSSRNP